MSITLAAILLTVKDIWGRFIKDVDVCRKICCKINARFDFFVKVYIKSNIVLRDQL